MMKKDKLVRNLLDKAAAEFIEMTKKDEEKQLIVSTNTRLAHYEKNYKAK